MGDIEHLDFSYRTFGEKVARVLLKPVEGFIPILVETKDKPLSELTSTEALAWIAVGIYGGMVALAVGHVTANVLAVLVRGPVYRR